MYKVYTEYAGDDGIAIHGRFGGVVRVSGTNVTIAYPSNFGNVPKIGDPLKIYGVTSKSNIFEAIVQSVRPSSFVPTVPSKIFDRFNYADGSVATYDF